MRTYGKTIGENNGFSVIEVWDDAPDGVKKLIGYAILDPSGNEIGFIIEIGEALEELKRLADDAEQSPSPN